MKKVVIGMSGGVDSSVAAYILKERGFDVIGVTMQMFTDKEGACISTNAVEDAKRVAEQLKIPHYVMDFGVEFKKNVMDYFVDEYLRGHTPNPCIACNRYVKWEALLKRGRELGADCIATGHYARIKQLPNQRYVVSDSVTSQKDQTYALYQLTQEQLSHTLMPVGDYTKSEIRSIAGKIGLDVASKPDSQDICFLPENNYAEFICKSAAYSPVPGNFVDTKGHVLGTHKGLIYYTVGQRKGLGLSLGMPYFVVRLIPETNEVVLGTNDEVFTTSLTANSLNWQAINDIGDEELVLKAKVRYSHKGSICHVRKIENDRICCEFDEPVRAVTPGQAVVFYKDDYIVGGGTIE